MLLCFGKNQALTGKILMNSEILGGDSPEEICNPGPTDQIINDGRLTLKKSYLEFLGNPSKVDISYGPGRCILIHNPERRKAFVKQILPPLGEPLNKDESFVELRLNSEVKETPVDDQGRLRIEQVYLEWAGLTGKTKVYLRPRVRHLWIEVWNAEGYFGSLEKPDDPWEDALNRVVERLREHRQP